MPTPAIHWENCLEHASQSDIGLRRSNNQDALAVVVSGSLSDWAARGHLFMVADGMGAHAAGELASKMAVDIIPLAFYKLADLSSPEAIRAAIEEANRRIHLHGQENPDFRGMGTTASVLLLLPEGAVVAHVGDSRVYRLRGQTLQQLSFDHSLVWELMAGGGMREADVPSYIPKNIITRSLGPGESVQVDVEGPYPLETGDIFLLCSDGLSGQVSDEEIGVILFALPPADAAQLFIDLANLRGGPDNISVIVARVSGPEIARQTGRSPTAAGPSGERAASALGRGGWLGLGLLLASAGAAWWGGFRPAAAAFAAAAVGLGVLVGRAAVVGRKRETAGVRQGRGPYTTRECVTNNDFVDKLAKIAQQLRDAATDEGWIVEWKSFQAFTERALSAAAEYNYVAAVREYCRAISFMMEQLRQQRARK